MKVLNVVKALVSRVPPSRRRLLLSFCLCARMICINKRKNPRQIASYHHHRTYGNLECSPLIATELNKGGKYAYHPPITEHPTVITRRLMMMICVRILKRYTNELGWLIFHSIAMTIALSTCRCSDRYILGPIESVPTPCVGVSR